MWKKYQQQKKVNSKIKLALIALGSLLLLLLLAKLITLVGNVNSSLGLNLPGQNNISWDSKSAPNIVFVSLQGPNPQISLLNYQPKDKKLNVLNFSDQIYATAAKNYGSWKLGSIYKLGEEEKKNQGALLLKLTISKLIGLPVDGIVITNSAQPVDQLVADWHKNPLKILAFLQSIKTDLSLSQSGSFFYSISKVRSDKVSVLDMAQSNITESKLLPDSSRVLGVDNIRLDVFIRDNLQDALISEEGATVAVFNATNHQGLGSEVARVITNLGSNVVFISNTEEQKEESSLILGSNQPKDQKLLTQKRLTQIFAPSCLKKVCSTSDSKITSSRAQINLVIGEDYYLKAN